MVAHYKYLREERDRLAAANKCSRTKKTRFAFAEDALERARKWLSDALRGHAPSGMASWKGRFLRVYECRLCDGWHVTSKPVRKGLRSNPKLEVRA